MATPKKDTKNNTWYFVISNGFDANGKRKQIRRRGFKTKKEAEKAMNEILHSIHTGTYVKPSKLLYKEYLEQWLDDKRTKVRESTIETYHWLISKHIIPSLGHIEISKLTPMIIQQLYNDLINQGRLSGENMQKVHTLINDSLKKAERWGLIQRNVAALVDRPKAQKKEIQIWNREELKQFLSIAKEHRIYIAFLLAATTGMRQGEILGLRWKDINFNAGNLQIVQTLRHNTTELQSHTKTASGTRSIAIDEFTIRALKRHRKQVNEEKLSAGSLYEDNDLVVCTTIGTPMFARNVLRTFYNLIKKADVHKIRFHDLRHTHATLLLLQGVNPKIVSERLGHADVRITLDTYSHLLPNMQKDVANEFGRILFGEEKSTRNDIIKESRSLYMCQPLIDIRGIG